jgi:hypothetical protein
LKGSPTCKGALTKFRDEFIEQQLASLRQGLDKDGLSEAEQQELLSAKLHLLRLKQTKLTPKSDQA